MAGREDNMTAKKYLQQLRSLDIKIKQRKEQIRELQSLASGQGSFDYSKERVQTSVGGDKLSENVSRYVDIEKEVDKLIAEFTAKKDRIISEIQSLEDSRYIEILYKRYVEFKKFELIAVEMNYDYDWIRRLHGQALEAFARTHINTHFHVL